MKSKTKLALLFMLPVALTSCGQGKSYIDHLEDYVYSMTYHDGFNILQLTDIHWNYNTSTPASMRYLDKVFEETARKITELQGPGSKIDLVELTGDQFMLANTYHVKSFLDYFEAKAEVYGFKYAIIWGNHDHHGLYNPNWLSGKFKSAAHAIYFDEEDDLYGRSNFVIDLKQGDQVKWQIANIDSGASFSETAISISRDYDYIHPDQTNFWLKEHERVGKEVPAIAYYHIPQQENLIAWNEIHNDHIAHKNKFFKLEKFCDNGNPQYASDFIDRSINEGHNLKAAFMGHAHNIDWTVEYKDKVTIGLGVKTGPELYFAHISVNDTDPAVQEGLASTGITEDFDLIGASLVTLKNATGSFGLQHLYLNERASGDFVRWVDWNA